LFVYESDGFTIAKSNPGAVVFPMTTDEVVRVVQLLNKIDVQIIPAGTGTGLTGGCTAYANGAVISLVRMNKVLKIDFDNRVAHVEAGVRNTALSDAVAILPLEVEMPADDVHDVPPQTSPARDPADGRAGEPQRANRRSEISNPYHFAPDPSSQRASTIGGNASTNAGGIHTLKDFVSSNHILGFEIVLSDGTVMKSAARTAATKVVPSICRADLRPRGHVRHHHEVVGAPRAQSPLVPHDRRLLRDDGRRVQCGQRRDRNGHVAGGDGDARRAMVEIIEDSYHFGFPAARRRWC
jgi:FAD/FMN-containing dehydrogenase